MENAVTAKADGLLPGGRDVPFAQIEATLARLVRDGRRRRGAPARALLATVIAVGVQERLTAAAEALEQLGDVGVRAILISEGTHTSPIARVTEHSIAIAGLAPRYLNNAVAALRLSSLPAAVWWRGGSVEALDDLADLADRLILDTPDPDDVWAKAAGLFEHTVVTDMTSPASSRTHRVPCASDGVRTRPGPRCTLYEPTGISVTRRSRPSRAWVRSVPSSPLVT